MDLPEMLSILLLSGEMDRFGMLNHRLKFEGKGTEFRNWNMQMDFSVIVIATGLK